MTSFQLQKPKISDGAVSPASHKNSSSLSWVFAKEIQKIPFLQKGVKAIPHPFPMLLGWENEECEEQQGMLNSPGVNNSVCSQNKPHTGVEPIGWYKL